MEIKLTRRVSGIAESATLAISAKAKKLKAEGRDVVNFGVGEPDFNTPDYIIEAAIKAMKEGKTKYTPASGIPELKKAIVENRKLATGVEYSPSQVVIGAGAKQPLYNAIAALAEEGDEVIVPSPYWVTYPELAKFCGAKNVFVETKPENGYKMTAEELEKAITPKTKLLILNSPNNPTGAVYSREELSAIADVGFKSRRNIRRFGRNLPRSRLRRGKTRFDRLARRRDKIADYNHRRNEQILRDDGLENRLGDRARKNRERDDESAEPYDVQRQFRGAVRVARGADEHGKIGRIHCGNA